MTDYQALLVRHADLSEKKQIEISKSKDAKMKKKHTDFLKTLLKLIDDKEIDPLVPESFINKKVYDKMPLEWKGKVELALFNIAHQIQNISEFYHSADTPTASTELENMIDHLWQMKERIEEKYDVFKF